MIFMDMLSSPYAPKRGDIVQTNVGDRRERTWLILRARRVRRREPGAVPRYALQLARWWELEVEMRLALARSAERNGGQHVFAFHRYPPKKRRTFEQYMSRNILAAAIALLAVLSGCTNRPKPVTVMPVASCVRKVTFTKACKDTDKPDVVMCDGVAVKTACVVYTKSPNPKPKGK